MGHAGGMTSQIPDTVRLDGSDFEIAGVDGRGLFDPTEHGLFPTPPHTACWSGYICSYAVVGDHLRLARLALGPLSQKRPATAVEIADREVTGWPALFGVEPLPDAEDQGMATYEPDLPIAFTGGLLLGDGFIAELYTHMGFHPAWKYERVVEAIFDGGTLVRRQDRSAVMAELRDAIARGERGEPDGDPLDDSVAWVKRTFELDYERSE